MPKTKLAVAVLVAAVMLPVICFAQSTSSVAALQAQIQALIAQVQTLQQELAQVTAMQSGSGSSTTVGSASGSGSCYTFSSNLSRGSTGYDVTELQTVLHHQDPSLSITGTFGQQTAAAVTNFQQTYSNQILTPNGLQTGTGYVGKSTRSQLNELYGCPGTAANPPPALDGSGSSSVSIVSLSPLSGAVGTQVTITGKGFTATKNNIHFGVGGIASVNSADGTHLTVQVPQSVGPCDFIGAYSQECAAPEQLITPGSYPVSVSNINGTSNSLSFVVGSATE